MLDALEFFLIAWDEGWENWGRTGGIFMGKKKRLSTSGGGGPLRQNPFSGLDRLAFPEGDAEGSAFTSAGGEKSPETLVRSKEAQAGKSRGRVDIIRQTAHRGGKTVLVVTNFVGVGRLEKEALARKMRKVAGVGGTVKDGNIEIQGNRREQVAAVLREAGFRPVFAGG